MKINMFTTRNTALMALCGGIVSVSALSAAPAQAQMDMAKRPSLVITSQKSANAPNSVMSVEPPAANYGARGVRVPASTSYSPSANSGAFEISPSQISGSAYYQPMQTIVAGKVNELRSDLNNMRERVGGLSSQLRAIQDRSRSMSAEYNASVATINTQLQTGTTPGNPRLVQQLSTAQTNLDRMSQTVAELNTMAVEAANAASMGSYLLESCRSAYGISGAVEEDHVALAQVEDEVNSQIVTVDRVLNEVNDAITRTAAYLSAERNNLRTLSLAVTNGDYYGPSLAGRPFSSAQPTTIGSSAYGGSMAQPASYAGGYTSSMTQSPGPAPVTAAPLSGPRPLVKIRFDKPNVNYEQAVYMAINEAMQKYPGARFELIAVNPSVGNAAQIAIESTRARRNAETVLRSLSQMGVDISRIDLSTQESAEARSNEVHIFIKA